MGWGGAVPGVTHVVPEALTWSAVPWGLISAAATAVYESGSWARDVRETMLWRMRIAAEAKGMDSAAVAADVARLWGIKRSTAAALMGGWGRSGRRGRAVPTRIIRQAEERNAEGG